MEHHKVHGDCERRRRYVKSNGWVGLTAEVDGQPIGDLVTVVHNYDEDTCV